MNSNMNLTSDKTGQTESGKNVPIGTTVEYVGHVIGGMISVILNGSAEVMNPNCFKELR